MATDIAPLIAVQNEQQKSKSSKPHNERYYESQNWMKIEDRQKK